MKNLKELSASKNPKLDVIWKFAENTAAYALPVFFQQFIVYPLMAKKLGAEVNGLFLALIALNYFIINITASVLVNTRLLRTKEYEAAGEQGDYNAFLLIFALLGSAAVLIGTLYYAGGTATFIDTVLSILVLLLFLYHDYIAVQYRSELRFSNILINNLIICAGYLAGLAVMWFVLPYWQMVFIVPYLLTGIYDWFNTDYIREPLRITPLLGGTAKQYFILLGSTLLSTVVTYGDRLILLPLLDGTSVSVFSSAQLIGKMLQMVSTPLSTFILAYLVRKNSLSLKLRTKHWLAVIAAGGVLYLACILVSRPLIGFLYPGWAAQSLEYVPFTAATGLLHMTNVILNVVILRFGKKWWQILKSSVYLAAYMIFSFTLLSLFELRGFCIGNLLASVSEFVLLLVLSVKTGIFSGKMKVTQAEPES